MKIQEAIDIVEGHGISMVESEAGGVELVAVGRKSDEPLAEGDDFCVTAFVKEKLTPSRLKERGIQPFTETFAANTKLGEPREFRVIQ